MNLRDTCTIQNALTVKAHILLGQGQYYSEPFTFPIGKSFLFFDNVGDYSYGLILHNMREYEIESGKSGIITYNVDYPIPTQLALQCRTQRCQGLVMITSCAD